MGKVKVSIVYLSKDNQKKGISASLPDDMIVGEILQNLCEKLDLLQGEDFDADSFALYSRENNKTLSKKDDLLSQGVEEGGTLIIKTKKASAPVERVIIEEEPQTEPEQEVEAEDEKAEEAEQEPEAEENLRETTQETYYEPVEEDIEIEPFMICPNCQNKLSWDDAFCRKCGQKVTVIEEIEEDEEAEEEEQVLLCPVCNNEVSKDDAFCKKCGQWLENMEDDKKKKKKGGAMRSALVLLFIISLTFVAGVVLERKGIIKVPYILTQEETQPQQDEGNEIITASDVVTEANEDKMTVEVTIQSDFLDEDDMPEETLSQEQFDKGYTAVKINEDGSVTYTIIKSEWRKLLEEFKNEMIETVSETTREYKAVDRIVYDESFSEFTISVNREYYKYDFDSTVCLSLYMAAGYYQMYNQEEPGCTFKLIDASSKTVIDQITFPLGRR